MSRRGQHRPVRTLSIQRQPSTEEDSRGDVKYSFLPAELGNPKVQESDGSFFESFTALSWKQENRRLRAANEDEKEADKAPPSELLFGPRQKIHRLQDKEFELLYIEVLYTIKHKIGTTSGGHLPFIRDLYLYAQDAFGISPEEHARLLAKASEEKAPIVILNCTVVEGKDLEAKDANGFSDPYCMLGIMPGRKASAARLDINEGGTYSSDEELKPKEKRSALKKFSQSIKRKKEKHTVVKDILPAKYIKSTTVQPCTLNPNWNEKFRFDLDDPKSDRLHLDIWDHDEEVSVFDAASKLNEIQSLKGLGRVFKQIAQSARAGEDGAVDDFLGCVNVPLDCIPSTGIDKFFDLEGRSNRSNVQGQIRLKLNLATREDRGVSEEDNWTDIKQHEDLYCIFIEHEIRKYQDAKYRWDGELPQAAQTILHQHAIQGDITEVQRAMCRWAAYSKKHLEHPFDYEVLYRLLEDLDSVWEPSALSREEDKDEEGNEEEKERNAKKSPYGTNRPRKTQEESLAESFNLFIEFCLGLLRKLRQVFPAANRAAQVRLDFMLRCLAKIYQMSVFRKCCPFQKELHSEIVAVLKKGNLEWYEKQYSITRPQTNVKGEDEIVVSLSELTNIINTDCQKSLLYYDKSFEKIGNVKYFGVLYKQLEKMISDDISAGLEEELGDDVNKEMDGVKLPKRPPSASDQAELDCPGAHQQGTQLFELYLALQEFTKFRENLPASERKSLAVSQHYEWFKPAVERWLPMAKHKLMQRIKKAVELDKIFRDRSSHIEMSEVESGVKHSTSAVDVSCCFGQIIEFWRQLSWPDLPTAYPFITKITDDMCVGATYYADLIHGKLKNAGYYDEVGQFDVTEQRKLDLQLCITINNIEQVRRALKPLPEALQFAEVLRAMERVKGEKAFKQARQSLMGIIRGADDEMVKKIKQVVDRVADKMRPDLKKDVFHLCWAPESVPAEDAIGDLMTYLDSNLLTLNTNLLRTNFDRILHSIWVECLEELRDVITADASEEDRTKQFYRRMYDSLSILVEFFHANEKGLKMSIIKGPEYVAVERLLRFNKADTGELESMYFIEHLQLQKETETTKFGTLSTRVYYNFDAEILCVEVLSAKDVIPLDTNGLSDPFVMIELCPSSVFPNQTVQKTRIIKKTLHPLFDESFEFNVTADQCKESGAVVLFTVMDHDIMFTNDFAGEVVLSLNNIPGVNGEEVTGFNALKSTTSPLIQVKEKGFGPLAILEQRATDPKAQEFVKKRRAIEAKVAT
ncbi:BAI1-associated protein 3-like isoform X4 [Lineus longissimus]|uniref:BAI1-associated protein 3-like isoform X4 n=1 Tax=Lineus longissimus TaxID=88925 RepID=UPI00315DDFA1